MTASGGPPSSPVLELANLHKQLGRRMVLRGVDVAVHAGRVAGLVGPNGAGKTTLMRIAAGLLAPDKGVVRLRGGVCAGHQSLAERARRGLGYLAQGPTVFRRLSVWENLESVPGADAARCEVVLQQVGLEGVRSTLAGLLSGGERRRLEIARLLLLEVRVLLCDEPFAGLDPAGIAAVSQLLRDVARSGAGIMITDHRVDVLFELCDTVAVLLDGRIAFDDTPEALRLNDALQQRYLGGAKAG